MLPRVLVSLAAVFAVAVAQIPTPPPCVLSCSTQAASATDCVSFTNITCACTSEAFKAATLTCLQANCTTADQQTSLALQTALCSSVSSSDSVSIPSSLSSILSSVTGGTGSSTPATTTGSASSPVGSGTTPSDSATTPTSTTGAAGSVQVTFGAAAVGVLFAAFFAL
ncbi:hypothetical protein EXIGLDRAFT_763891 [Exidia glandulosa HHB12029]|uniref:CFEM domain-containing protein n=1 Tax=Exidia glandulosa HHB12029 TaxID=1314781 RepID=A0A165LLT3_EXIGL|nr:hypothetical protein EXIGLDRAFT_763891 [Exidia glandulosa HHB12029]